MYVASDKPTSITIMWLIRSTSVSSKLRFMLERKFINQMLDARMMIIVECNKCGGTSVRSISARSRVYGSSAPGNADCSRGEIRVPSG